MTCNLSCNKIFDGLGSHVKVQNRFDLIAHIFQANLDELKIELFKWKIFY